jgi:hypothetical protein
MPFYEGFVDSSYGMTWWALIGAYCQTDTSASDYGQCYLPAPVGTPLFAYSGSSTLPCQSSGTCTVVSDIPWDYIITLKDNTSVGKQLIIYKTWVVANSNVGDITDHTCGQIAVRSSAMPENTWYPFMFKTVNFASRLGPSGYNVLDNSVCAYNVFYTPPVGKQIVSEWSGASLAMKIIIDINMRKQSNVYYAFYAAAYFAQELSPLAIIPLGYDKEWLPYQELRSAFGFSINGVDQPGWNADDIIRVLRELFPNRAWAVFDDRQYVLYLYNLTPDYVPDWLIEKLAPTAMKVLRPPADATVAKAWLDLLNERNAQIPPQVELP